MSIIQKVGSTLVNLEKVLDEYRANLTDYKDNIKLNGKNLEMANVEQPSWLAYYDQMAAELYSLLAYVDMKEREIRGKTHRIIKDTYHKEYNDSAIQKVIDSNPDYLIIHKMYIETEEVYMLAKSIVKCFEQRSYTLNNIVRIRENELHNITIRINE